MRFEKFPRDTNRTGMTKSLLLQFQERTETREGTVFLPDNENWLWGFIGLPIRGSPTVIYLDVKSNCAKNLQSSQSTKKTKNAWSFAFTSLYTFRIFCSGHSVTAKNVSEKVITMEST